MAFKRTKYCQISYFSHILHNIWRITPKLEANKYVSLWATVQTDGYLMLSADAFLHDL